MKQYEIIFRKDRLHAPDTWIAKNLDEKYDFINQFKRHGYEIIGVRTIFPIPYEERFYE